LFSISFYFFLNSNREKSEKEKNFEKNKGLNYSKLFLIFLIKSIYLLLYLALLFRAYVIFIFYFILLDFLFLFFPLIFFLKQKKMPLNIAKIKKKACQMVY